MRKITIPYSNFMSNSQISANQMNLNFDEIEYVFNVLFEDYVEYKKFMDTEFVGSFTDEEIDSVIANNVFYDYQTGYATDEEIADILFTTADESVVGDVIVKGIRGVFITVEEISEIVRSGFNG